jgi:hypothetical protein
VPGGGSANSGPLFFFATLPRWGRPPSWPVLTALAPSALTPVGVECGQEGGCPSAEGKTASLQP